MCTWYKCVYVCAQDGINVSICLSHTFVHIYTHLYHTYAHVYQDPAHMRIHIYTMCTYTHLYNVCALYKFIPCVCVHIHIYTYTYTHIHIYAYIHTYTHIHMHIYTMCARYIVHVFDICVYVYMCTYLYNSDICDINVRSGSRPCLKMINANVSI